MAPNRLGEISVTQSKLIIAEGRDVGDFCRAALKAYGVGGFQIINAGGVSQIPPVIMALPMITGFEQARVNGIAIVRDAEAVADSAVDSVRNALRKADLPVPDVAFQTAQEGGIKTAIAILPGLDKNGKLIPSGSLEDLCLATVDDEAVLTCVDAFLDCCEAAGCDLRRRHKAKLHAYLASNDKFVGMSIGLASKANAWDWKHPQLDVFRELLCNL